MLTDGIVINWLKEVWKFAYILTTNAVYDRVAIVQEDPHKIIIEYPKKQFDHRGKPKYRIMQEWIPRRDIVEVRSYRN